MLTSKTITHILTKEINITFIADEYIYSVRFLRFSYSVIFYRIDVDIEFTTLINKGTI
jgi:hypothetical protein